MKFVFAVLSLIVMFAAQPVLAAGGHYAGGHGSSHKGGHYKNAATGDHYQHRK